MYLITILEVLFLNILIVHGQSYRSYMFQDNNQRGLMSQTNPNIDVLMRKMFRQQDGGVYSSLMNQNMPFDSTYSRRGIYPQDFNFKVQRNPDGRLDVVESPKLNQRNSPVTTGIVHFPTPPTRATISPVVTEPTKLTSYAPHCSSESFCTQVDNYPLDLLEQVIQKEANKFEVAFGDDLVPEIPEVSQRIDPGEESLCTSVERLIFPKAAMTKDNNWNFIVNHSNYTQGVRIEECSDPGNKCAMSDSFPNGYKTECKQKYIYRQLLGFLPNGKVVKEMYRLPSCCKCILKFH